MVATRRRFGYPAITFPRLGTATIAFQTVFESLGMPVIMAPDVGPETIALGVRHSPECACFPLKVNIGNYLQAYELGARAAVMIGGIGPCRLGYYAEVQQAILRDLGVDFELLMLDPPSSLGWHNLAEGVRRITGGASLVEIARALRLAWAKAQHIDGLTALSHILRPREQRQGAVSSAFGQICGQLAAAMTHEAIAAAGKAGLDALNAICLRDDISPVRVGVVGEVYMVWESSVNQNCIETLGHLGCEVEQTVWFSHWLRNNLPLGPWRARGEGSEAHYRQIARPYLGHSVGGEGQPNVGHTIDLARRGFDGIVHLAPFTCMPEIVARTVLDAVSRDYGIPVLTFFLDEHAGEAGMQTRLEAFVDMLRRRRQTGVAGLAAALTQETALAAGRPAGEGAGSP
jgi:predicted nucleotide-binding protein (sugar kinase/HSP70/actin superfamily)